MFSLTSREQVLLLVVLGATLLGAAVKHWRDTRREQLAERTPAPAAQLATPSRPPRRLPAKPHPAPEVALAEETAPR